MMHPIQLKAECSGDAPTACVASFFMIKNQYLGWSN